MATKAKKAVPAVPAVPTVSELTVVESNFHTYYGDMIGTESQVSNLVIYNHLLDSNILPAQICSPKSSNESMFTKEGWDRNIEIFHANQHPNIRDWFKPKWDDVEDGGKHVDGSYWFKNTSGLKTDDYRECNKANHTALKKRASDKISNLQKGYNGYLANERIRFKEKCVADDIDPVQAERDHKVFGQLAADEKELSGAVKSKNTPLAKLAKAVQTEAKAIGRLVGAQSKSEDDKGNDSILFDDDIRDLVPAELITLLEDQRAQCETFSKAMVAFDLDPDVQDKIGKYTTV
tara:strand:- start:323 stop:1195 length:873 start_codon:yes stop_codon:yes gene_type:complete